MPGATHTLLSQKVTIAAMLALTAGIIGLLIHRAAAPAAAASPLAVDVYVWQRAWSQPVVQAVTGHGGAFQKVIALSRQIAWENGTAHITRVGVDWAAIKASGAHAGVAIRIGSFGGPFEGASADAVTRVAAEALAEARSAGVEPAELQIDFDAAAARLAGYKTWVEHIKAESGAVPVVITALPSWLDRAEFAPLARAAGSYVLQVHGIEKPHDASQALVLCDPAAARRAIAKAGRLGVPFRVALPTYSYAVAFNADGTYAGMAAEGAAPGWGEGKQVKLAEARPDELAALVRELSAGHPAALQGIIWYRLPVEADRLNWPWATLAAVMAGRAPAPSRLTVNVAPASDGVAEIRLTNAGETDADMAVRIMVTCEAPAEVIAGDALAGFAMAHGGNQWTLAGAGDFTARLHPGETRAIGWLRLAAGAGVTPIKAQVE